MLEVRIPPGEGEAALLREGFLILLEGILPLAGGAPSTQHKGSSVRTCGGITHRASAFAASPALGTKKPPQIRAVPFCCPQNPLGREGKWLRGFKASLGIFLPGWESLE